MMELNRFVRVFMAAAILDPARLGFHAYSLLAEKGSCLFLLAFLLNSGKRMAGEAKWHPPRDAATTRRAAIRGSP